MNSKKIIVTKKQFIASVLIAIAASTFIFVVFFAIIAYILQRGLQGVDLFQNWSF